MAGLFGFVVMIVAFVLGEIGLIWLAIDLARTGCLWGALLVAAVIVALIGSGLFWWDWVMN